MIAMVTPTNDTESCMTTHRVLLVDDHPGFRRGIASVIADEAQFTVCGEASTAPGALDAMRRLKPDLVVVDISMPGTNGIELIKMMVAEQPHLNTLVLSMHDESVYALRALRAGAKGYIMKAESLECIVAGLHKVAAGEVYVSPKFNDRLIFKAIQVTTPESSSPIDKLSDRELEVMQLLGKGYGTREIAEQLHLSVKTVETHRGHIKEKLGFKESGDMVRFAIDWVTHQEGDEVLPSRVIALQSLAS